jgi:hypothetical protein
MTVVILSVLTVLSIAVGFAFGRNYEAAQRKRKPESPSAVLDLHPHEWERVV